MNSEKAYIKYEIRKELGIADCGLYCANFIIYIIPYVYGTSSYYADNEENILNLFTVNWPNLKKILFEICKSKAHAMMYVNYHNPKFERSNDCIHTIANFIIENTKYKITIE